MYLDTVSEVPPVSLHNTSVFETTYASDTKTLPFSVCGCRKFRSIHLETTSVLVPPTRGSRGQRCGDIELTVYLTNETDPVPLVLDLHISHER
jgi:hypothetical protein